VGGAVALLAAAGLFTRYGIGGNLSRDESIYAYGGQQFAHGVPPYVSIFDPKTPLATMLAGLGVLIGNLFGAHDLDSIRVVFFVFSCLCVLAVYGLTLLLWESPAAALLAAVVFASFRGFAIDALGGPDAKTPGIFLALLSMALLYRRHWFWGAVSASLAFLVWQPLGIYAALAVLAAALGAAPGEWRRDAGRAVAGALIPVVAITLYFWLAGALHAFLESAFVFPATGIERPPETVGQRIEHIAQVVGAGYPHGRALFWGGLVLLCLLLGVRVVRGRGEWRRTLADPLVCVVFASFAGIVAYSITDFQGYPDLYPLLPYAAIGWGGAAAWVAARLTAPRLRLATGGVVVVAAAVLAGLSWNWFGHDRSNGPALAEQRANAATLERVTGPGRVLYALGNPTPLVLTGRRNPSRFVYLSSGVGRWVVKHTHGGLPGWERRVRATRPAAIVVGDLNSNALLRLMARLRSVYPSGALGRWTVFVDPALRDQARRSGLAVG
jgi:hypothetical protein